VDLTPFVYNFDGRKILIGGMRLGGAACTSGDNCVKPPSDTCGSNGCVGLSAYFALDVTDPEPDKVKVLWEFTNPELGFSYSGPAIVRKGNRAYALFVSGPTNYDGDSDQPLRVFVVDLLTGKLIRTVDTFIPAGSSSGEQIDNAFGGRLMKEALDVNGDGSSDYLFFGYSQKGSSVSDWKGGLVMADLRDSDPNNWKFYTYFAGQIQPVTAKVKVGYCFGKPFVYFGTGRWFFKVDNPNPTVNNELFGLPLECKGNSCTLVTDYSDSPDEVCNAYSTNSLEGWVVKLNVDDEGYFKERLISDPTTTEQNVVLFATVEPTDDVCASGGRTRVWALNCATGGPIDQNCSNYQVSKVYGTLLLQLSTANMQQITIRFDRSNNVSNLSSTFTEAGGRATGWFSGIAPESAPPFISPSGRLVGTLLLWLER
jgi:type IV pilus assembly protein PilY1